MTYWISVLINKPLERFKNPKLLDDTVSAADRKNIKNINFTLNRTLPLTMTFKKKEINIVILI